MEYEITIKDENGNVVCDSVPFGEERLQTVSDAAGGLQDFIRKYKKKIE